MVMLFNLGSDDAREREAIQALSSYQVEGFILHTLGHDGTELNGASYGGKPVVLVDRRLGNALLDLVGLDNVGAVRLAAGHLIEAGYRHLLYVTESMKGISSREERAAAFRAFIGDSPAAPARGRYSKAPSADEDALDAALLALKRRAGKDAACRACGQRRHQPARQRRSGPAGLGPRLRPRPGGLRRSGLGAAGRPGTLEPIAQPTDDIGRLAARCLIERLEGESGPPRQILLPGQLIARGSSRSLTAERGPASFD